MAFSLYSPVHLRPDKRLTVCRCANVRLADEYVYLVNRRHRNMLMGIETDTRCISLLGG